MQTRSVDDIRNYWMLKVLPLLAAHDKKSGAQSSLTKWTEDLDISLLQSIVDQEVSDLDEALDFCPKTVGNDNTAEENRSRWNLLLKGLASVMPGRRFSPSAMARKMIDDIKSSPERYVQWAVPKNVARGARTGMNHYINIHSYYKEHFV